MSFSLRSVILDRPLVGRLCAATGGGLLFVAALRGFTLAQGSLGARAFVVSLLLALAALAVFLLYRSDTPVQLLLCALLPVGLAFFLRALCLDYLSYDYKDFLAHWAEFFRTHGGIAAVRLPVGNYNAPYLYFMALISYLPVPDLYLIKLFSILFDVLLAWGGLRLVRRYCKKDSLRPVAAFCLLLLLPTVVLNGAYWGQCDALYGALVIHALASALDGKPSGSVVLLAVAFSFKLQTVFLLPFWGVLWFAKRIKFSQLWLFPLTYVGTILPALLLGKPLGDILGVYVGQAGEYPELTLNAPSMYALVPYGVELPADASKVGILAAFALVLALLGLLFLFRKRITDRVLLLSAALLAVGVPFLLPHMHDRYFFLADTLFLVWACIECRRIPLAVLVQGASLSAYSTYLRLQYTFPLQLGSSLLVMGFEALFLLAALVSTVILLLQALSAPSNQPTIDPGNL